MSEQEKMGDPLTGPGSSQVEPAGGLDASHSIPIAERRPDRLTPETALRAATALANRLAKAHLIEAAEIDKCAEDIAKYGRRYMDGYELAKALDGYCCWDCDLMMADELDSFSCRANDEIEAAEKEWFARNDIQPPLPIGAHVRINARETGIITEIYSYGVGKYCVAIDGDPMAGEPSNRRSIVNFEDAQGIEAQRAETQSGSVVDESPTPQGDAPQVHAPNGGTP